MPKKIGRLVLHVASHGSVVVGTGENAVLVTFLGLEQGDRKRAKICFEAPQDVKIDRLTVRESKDSRQGLVIDYKQSRAEKIDGTDKQWTIQAPKASTKLIVK